MKNKNDMNEIRKIRFMAGMTQEEFSDFLEIPKRTIEDWESNRRVPPKYLVNLISYRVLGY